MRISSSGITLASSQINARISTVRESLRIWDNNADSADSSQKGNRGITPEIRLARNSLHLSRSSFQADVSSSVSKKPTGLLHSSDEEFVGDLKAQIMKDIIEMFTGRKIRVLKPGELKNEGAIDPPVRNDPAADTSDAATRQEGWGVDYQYHEMHYSKEGVSFTAAGTVATADGRTIKFNTALEMSRETYEETTISLKAGDALKDPLVIDLDGNGAAFSAMKFDFDIDSDGRMDRLYTPKQGAGILAYDKNGNGIIDDGSELFGPESGNGFSELALLDEDNNGWVDEGDSAFGRLRIWEKSADGTDSISSLLERGVGALYTGSAKSDYTITTGNEVAGILRESGVYLKENGVAGVLQEVDLVV